MSANFLPPGQSLKHPTSASRTCNITLFVLAFMFWIIWLAGIATTENVCRNTSGTEKDLHHIQGLYDDIQRLTSLDDCGMELSIEWWVLFFELLILICNLQVALGTVHGFRFEQTFLTFTAINTGLMVVMAPRSVVEARLFAFVMSRYPVARELTAAGNVGLLVLNFIYIIMYTDKTQKMRPVMRPGLPDPHVSMSPMPHLNGTSGEPALPRSSMTNPHYERNNPVYKENEMITTGPMSDLRV